MNGYIKIQEAMCLTGLGDQTLRKYFDEKKISGYKTPSGTRMFDKSCLEENFVNLCNDSKRINKKENIIYVRVSSKKQTDDLSRQLEYIRSRLDNTTEYTVISDVGSGINFKKKGIKTILDKCLQGSIGTVTIAHKDRLCRFGYELFEYLITYSGGTLRVLSEESINKSSEQELAEDLLSIVTIYSCRQMGKRKYGKRNSQMQKDSNQS
jgi:putative resolvase